MSKFKSTLATLSVAAALLTAAAPAVQADSVTDGSAASLVASGTILRGSGEIVAAATDLTIASVRTVGNSVELVLKNSAGAVAGSIVIPAGAVAEAVLNAAGELAAVATQGGIILAGAAGEVIAFVPNKVGQALTHNAAYAGAAQ